MYWIRKIDIAGVLCSIICSSALGDISFVFGDSTLQSIEFTEDTEFLVTTPGNDAGLILVLKDVYQQPTEIPDYFISDQQVFQNTIVELNGNIPSFASWFSTMIETSDEWPVLVDIENLDILIHFKFDGYDPFDSAWSLGIGDSITVKSGFIYDISNLDIPNPDNIGGSVTAQFFSPNYPIVFTDEQQLTVVPEPRETVLISGIVVMCLLGWRRFFGSKGRYKYLQI